MNEVEQGTDGTAFVPDWISPPGETILDLLEERDWTQQQLADRLGFSPKHVNQLIKGKVPLTEDAAISAWLRLGERLAERMDGLRYSEARFRESLAEILTLTNLSPEEFGLRMQLLLQEAGVAFVVVPALPRSHVSGVARWINSHRPLIQLSLYGKTNDTFWFSFFNEAAHILLHSSQKKAVFLDDPFKDGSRSKEEQEANVWARDSLIPPNFAAELAELP